MKAGTRVTWHWGAGAAHGTVMESFEREVSRTLKGHATTRRGSKDDPALLIEQEDGDRVLKLASEVERA